MTDAVVDLNGQRRKVNVYKENNKTVLVHVPKGLRVRGRVRSVGRTFFEKLVGVPAGHERVEIPNNHVVKRHKVKHNLKWL